MILTLSDVNRTWVVEILIINIARSNTLFVIHDPVIDLKSQTVITLPYCPGNMLWEAHCSLDINIRIILLIHFCDMLICNGEFDLPFSNCRDKLFNLPFRINKNVDCVPDLIGEDFQPVGKDSSFLYIYIFAGQF